jgi:hypothetical protein
LNQFSLVPWFFIGIGRFAILDDAFHVVSLVLVVAFSFTYCADQFDLVIFMVMDAVGLRRWLLRHD